MSALGLFLGQWRQTVRATQQQEAMVALAVLRVREFASHPIIQVETDTRTNALRRMLYVNHLRAWECWWERTENALELRQRWLMDPERFAE